MSSINVIFEKLDNLTHWEGHDDYALLLKNILTNEENEEHDNYKILKSFLSKVFDGIDEVSSAINNDDTILISVKNQKILRTCFQIVTSLGISTCLIPGLGISLSKKCNYGKLLPTLVFNDEQKYELLVLCTDFLTRSYTIPVLKNIILTLHLSDYLSAIIQLSFAPLKKPGVYNNFVMTQELYENLCKDRQKYVQIYNNLVTTCFQPTLMKDLLVLQGVLDPPPPNFVKRVISKEMSQRLITPGGLLSLFRCFIDSYSIDTGLEWRKIDMICRIISAKHGDCPESDYLNNICSQLKQILCLNNTHYLTTAVACVVHLNDQYPSAEPVRLLVKKVFLAFAYDHILSQETLPGTLLLTTQEVEHKINILHSCVCTAKIEWPVELMTQNLRILFLIGVQCTKNDEMKIKVRDIVIKCLEKLSKDELGKIIKVCLFGVDQRKGADILVEENVAGVVIKTIKATENVVNEEALSYFLYLFKAMTDNNLVENIFEVALQVLIELSVKRQSKGNKDMMLLEDDPILLDDIDHQYAIILQFLSEVSTSPKVITSLKSNPSIVFNFIEHFILKQNRHSDDECVTTALVLLSTILSNSNDLKSLEKRFIGLTPILRMMAKDESSLNSILCREILSLLNSESFKTVETAYGKAVVDVFDNLLPVRAHGMMELTKLIDTKDAETLSKKHYIFCLFQEQLKDPDSYIYLSAINGLAALCTYCSEDVLHVLCKEFLQESAEQSHVQTLDNQNKIAELRMKVGDVIVKVTKRLGEMAIVHKTVLLNTILCGCRDEDPLIRTSALSNLAEIALVLNYKIGTIIYEVLLCIWGILSSDKAIECRRAAVMVISSLIKGLGKETLIQLKENLLPIYRTLKDLYNDVSEDSTVRLHAQIALEELNDVVNQFLFPEVKMEKQIFMLDRSEDSFK